MIGRRIEKDREKVFANQKTAIFISLLLLAIISAALLMPKQGLKANDITPENSSIKYTVFSHNELVDKKMKVISRDAVNERAVISIGTDKIDKATFNKINTSADFTLFLDTDIIGLKIEEYDTAKAYAIDPTKIDFSNATFIINATGKQLFKCSEYDFAKQECYGSWEKVMNLVPGRAYELFITKQDPAFIETNESQFDLGYYNRTFYNVSISAVQLNASYNNGTYASQVFDAGNMAMWNNISWTAGGYYQQELPDNQESETGPGGVNMSSNVLLVHLNEAAGIIIDYSGKGNNGTLNGTLFAQEGKLNSAIGFDGVDDYISINNSPSLKEIQNEMSFVLWAKANSHKTAKLVEKGDWNGHGLSQDIWEGWRVSFRINGTSYTIRWNEGRPDLGRWYHIAGVYNSTEVIIYVDGEQKNNISAFGVLNTNNYPILIGSASGQKYFNGTIDEVSVFNRTLSQDEIKNIYLRGALRLNLSVRNCSSADCSDGSWQDLEEYSPEELNLTSQYLQYRFGFETSNLKNTPILYNVSILYDVANSLPPEIELISPSNSTINETTNKPEFKFIAKDDVSDLLLCNLWLEDSLSGINRSYWSNDSVENGTLQSAIPNETISNNEYYWWINCSDSENSSTSEKRTITIYVDNQYPNISLILPTNTNNTVDFSSVVFSCLAEDDRQLSNVSLYSDYSGDYSIIETKEASGISDSIEFNKNLFDDNIFFNKKITWNCLVKDSVSKSSFANANFSFSNWDLGSYESTTYNSTSGHINLQASKTNGTYTSKVFNPNTLAMWNNISWTNGGYYQQELPDNKQVEAGGANMSGNVLLLHLNDGNGATAFIDTSGNNKNGSCSGGDCPTWTSSGKFGGAYSFDGNDRIGTQITTQYADFAVEVWFKDNSDNVQYERLADKSYTNCFWLGRNSNTPNSWGGGVMETTGSYGIFVNLQDGQWHQIVSMRRGTTHYIYGDGGKVIASNTVSSAACDATNLAIGAWGEAGSTQQRFTGIIDEVSFYNRSLSAQEIQDHYIRGIARLNLSVRSCDDEECENDSWNISYSNSSIQNLNISNSQFFQYKAEFFTDDASYSPQLYDVTIGYKIHDSSAPAIFLEWPEDDATEILDKTPGFRFNATDKSALTLSCSLWLNATTGGTPEGVASNSSVNNGSSTIITPSIPLNNNLYYWWTDCSNGFYSNISEKRTINISVPDSEPPIISLEGPSDNTINTTDNTPDFSFVPFDEKAKVLICELWISNGTLSKKYGTSSVNSEDLGIITANATLANQNYSWWINCSDGANTNMSEVWNIRIFVDAYAPSVSLNNPSNNASNVDFSSSVFNCSAADDTWLKNMSLYSDYNGAWQKVDSENISGALDYASFTKNIYQSNQFVSNNFRWNCLAYDNTSKSDWSSSNFTFSNWNLGQHSNTEYNAALQAITLDNYASDGSYLSEIFDAGTIVGWKNISWSSLTLDTNTLADYFNPSEAKSYYVQNTYSVRHWYNVSSILSDFSQIEVQAALDCDGSCAGTVYLRIGNSTSWSDYSFVNASAVRTDGTTSNYSFYNKTYNIGIDQLGSYFFVQLLIYTGSGTINFLMDENGPAGPDPEYRSGSNGDGSQAGWTNDNGDYAIKVRFIKNTNLNLSVKSCNDPDCNGESWSESMGNSTITRLNVPSNRYFQYKADLESSGGLDTPKLYNVTINYGLADPDKPSITLSLPADGVGDQGNVTAFVYSVDDESEIDSCSLFLNEALQDTDDSVEKEIAQEFRIIGIDIGTYEWKINCTDINGNENSSETRQITIVPSYEYGGQTTDLSNVSIENITNLIIENPSHGLINFSETINLSGGADINSHVAISDNLISIDSANIPSLNKSATLTIYNLNLQKPIIMKNSLPCNDCVILYYNGNLTFTVQSFSAYSASENSKLEIWDDSDISTKYENNQIHFYANYTNITSGEPINGASIFCNISFTDTGSSSMTYDNETSSYTYNRTFSPAGVYYFNITCKDTEEKYASINTTDYASINEYNSTISPANITVIKSERANLTFPPDERKIQGGNLTKLAIETITITKAWQGYYGQTTGTVYLKDSEGPVFYNWNITIPKGEIYATRAKDVNFATVNCSNQEQIANEETFIGLQPNDADTIKNTFNKNNHPQFNVGSITISENRCNSTNLYVNSNAQNTNFYQVLLSDAASNIIYAAIIDADKIGFDNQTHDFQMLVGENGRDEATTTYYFFVEII